MHDDILLIRHLVDVLVINLKDLSSKKALQPLLDRIEDLIKRVAGDPYTDEITKLKRLKID
jgi:ribosomal protein S15P/S13E